MFDKQRNSDIDKISKGLIKLLDSGDIDSFIIQQLRELLYERAKALYPIGSLCRIYTEVGKCVTPTHLVVGHICDNSNGELLIQIYPTNPRFPNCSYSNVSMDKVEIVN